MQTQSIQKWILMLAFFYGGGAATDTLTENKTHEVRHIRVWPAPDKTRVVLDLSDAVSYKLEALRQPDRVALDIEKTNLATDINQLQFNSSILSKIRYSKSNENTLRLVFDLNKPATARSFVLAPNQLYHYRLVLDFYESESSSYPKKAQKAPPPENNIQPRGRDITIAIDAGHGGDDPGAIGKKGTQEKRITLAIAKQLAQLIEKEAGLTPFLTRKGDYFLGLRERTNLARKAEADLFISIHADSYKSSKLRGSSVYVLSERRASSEAARWLAERENLSDLLGGVEKVDWNGSPREVVSILFDLIQSKNRKNSFSIGKSILKDLGKINAPHRNQVQQAGFVVLRAPDMPSLLIETAFLSNPQEEQKLIQFTFQKQIAEAIFRGIHNYFSRHPPEGTYYQFASNKPSPEPDLYSRLSAKK